MNCTKCYQTVENNALYCSQCGTPTITNPTFNKPNTNVIAVGIFLAYSVLVSISYKLLSYVIIPAITISDGYAAIPGLYNTVHVIFMLLELVICAVIIGIIKNTTARILVCVFAAFHLLMFIADKVYAVMAH